MSEETAIFRRSGSDWTPSELAQGPWNPEHLHGGAICGVLAHAVESCESPVPMRVTRLTVEMTRAVPLAPFRVNAEVSRAGRRLQQIDARIEAEGRLLARATALRLRVVEAHPGARIPFPEALPARPAERPADFEEERSRRSYVPGYLRALDYLQTRAADPGGSGVTWSRLRVPFVAGERTSPLVRLAALSDFASGVGNPVDFNRFTSINPDLSLHVLREPRGEWIGLEARTHLEGDGTGHSHSVHFDEGPGPVARTLISLLVEPR